MLAHAPATRHMSPDEYLGNVLLLIVGGNDTTRNTMSGIVHAFDKFPDQRKLFEEDPSLIPNAVQECIRYQTPLAHMRRQATADSAGFPRIPPTFARAGDVVLAGGSPRLGVVVDGGRAAFVGPRGLIRISLTDCTIAWRIG